VKLKRACHNPGFGRSIVNDLKFNLDWLPHFSLRTPYIANNKMWPVSGEELPPSNFLLRFADVGLAPCEQHLFLSQIGGLSHPIGGIASRLSGNASGAVRANQKSDLEKGDECQPANISIPEAAPDPQTSPSLTLRQKAR
jgi:hypothetical protein